MKIKDRVLTGLHVNGCYIGVLPMNELLLMVDIAQKRNRFSSVTLKYMGLVWHIFLKTK